MRIVTVETLAVTLGALPGTAAARPDAQPELRRTAAELGPVH